MDANSADGEGEVGLLRVAGGDGANARFSSTTLNRFPRPIGVGENMESSSRIGRNEKALPCLRVLELELMGRGFRVMRGSVVMFFPRVDLSRHQREGVCVFTLSSERQRENESDGNTEDTRLGMGVEPIHTDRKASQAFKGTFYQVHHIRSDTVPNKSIANCRK